MPRDPHDVSSNATPIRRIDLADGGFAVVVVAALLAVLPAQFVWMVLVDSTGWDARLPETVFMQLLPTITVAAAPAVAALDIYGRWRGAVVGALLVIAAGALASFTVSFWALCGGC